MSHEAVSWAWATRGLSAQQRLVLLRLADRVRKGDARTWPSVASMAADTELSRRTVQRALRGLQRRGLVRVEQPGGGYRTKTVYVLGHTGDPLEDTLPLWDDPLETDARGVTVTPHSEPERGVTDDARGVTDDARGVTDGLEGRQRDARNLIKNRKESSKESRAPGRGLELELVTPEVAPPSAPDGAGVTFAAFWELWPRKVARLEAERAWKAATKGTPADRILAGLEAWAASWRAEATDTRFIPHAATWLRGNRWEDPPAPAGPAGDRRLASLADFARRRGLVQ